MIITRNGKQYKLTNLELEKVYQERLAYHQTINIDQYMRTKADTKGIDSGLFVDIKYRALEKYWADERAGKISLFGDSEKWDRYIDFARQEIEREKSRKKECS